MLLIKVKSSRSVFHGLFPAYTYAQLLERGAVRLGRAKKNIYSSRVTRKERNRVGTKFSEGQLFIFRDRQDSCLPSAARLDSPGDQGKGKVGPRKILFLQDFSFLSG